MHEASIACGILDAVERTLADRSAARPCVVRVRIGRLAGVVADCLVFAWDVLREGTSAAGATLEIEEVPVTARCRPCQIEYGVEDVSLVCPDCGGLDVEMLSGREMVVSEIEIEEPDREPVEGRTA